MTDLLHSRLIPSFSQQRQRSRSRTSRSPTTSLSAMPSTPLTLLAVSRTRPSRRPRPHRRAPRQLAHDARRNNGKKLMAVRIVAHAFEIINLLTRRQPPSRSSLTPSSTPVPVKTRPVSARRYRPPTGRRCLASAPCQHRHHSSPPVPRESAFRNVKSIAECLADELINAAKGSSNSYAIKKRDEMERVCQVNR